MQTVNAKLVYNFEEANASMRDLLGGKGANLGEMTQLGLPVPPGFTITTEACRYYSANNAVPEALLGEIKVALAAMEKKVEKRFGDPARPLLVSVRSGAAVSMPGMMDTILNLGLNAETLRGLVAASGDARFAWDAYRRFVMMFSDVVLDIPKARFEKIFTDAKRALGVKLDTEVPAEHLEKVCGDFRALVEKTRGETFPDDPWTQLTLAVEAVFRSWNNDRAKVYRKNEGISDAMGTAVNIQAMVFGNLGLDCGTGVAFTRDPSTGENALYGEYLMNAQGEDVVAGVRTPIPLAELRVENPAIYDEFCKVGERLEQHFHDMMDLEFTIERGRLYMLQCRVGKRTGAAAVRMAVEMVGEGLITKAGAVQRVKPALLDQLLHPRINESDKKKKGVTAIATGLAASPGAAVGRIVFHANDAVAEKAAGQKVLLVREETNPDDVHGMLSAEGVLTARGGKTSHAAVVARGFGIPCVAGCEDLHIDEEAGTMVVGDRTYHAGDFLTLDGTTGAVYAEALALEPAQVTGDFGTLMSWCDEFRTLGVRTNADNPRDAAQAIAFGAQGIGLCRTEHMFFEADRLPIVRDMILTNDERQREAALAKLEVVQQADFEGIFRVMDGLPVTIRLIDPPLHEFLPSFEDLVKQVTELKLAANVLGGHAIEQLLDEKQALLKAVEFQRESNPMMGMRGVRLSIMMPGLVKMQTRAIMRAAIKVKQAGIEVLPEIMIPLVGHINELSLVKGQLEQVAREVLAEAGVEVPYKFGTMIEIPRAALTADQIATEAEFFSFGTNDLTQMTFGYSRDDAEPKFLKSYVDMKVLDANPFETVDQIGVGRLMRLAVEEGRKARPGLKCGICGEHGGDPESIAFCHEIGLDYVSCSPFRVPIARLAAAQAALKAKAGEASQASGE
jgi:pyruvate,orthophosphate dikinase